MTKGAIWRGTTSLESDTGTACRFWSRGYALDSDGRVHIGQAVGRYLSARRDRLEAVVPRLNGCYSAFLSDSERSVVITDRFGTVPVYIGEDREGGFGFSDDPWRLADRLASSPRICDAALIDLLHCGYVTGNRTLIDGIRTAAPATITRADGRILREERYWRYGYSPEAMDEGALTEALAELLRAVAARSRRVLGEMKCWPLLTLSGGLDSRLLAALFAASDGPPASCLSYGMATDPEVAVAAEIAQALCLDHRVVPVDKSYFNADFLARSVREVGITTRFTCGTGARHLACKSGELLVPGHTGDFISGGHLPPHTGLVRNRNQLHRFLDLRHFRYPHSDRILRKVLRAHPGRRFDGLAETTADFDMSEDILGLIDRWNVENRQRRLILMELRAYEGVAPWILPFYDYDLVDFFSRVPHSLRIGQLLYVKTALEQIFTGGAAALGTIRRVGNPLRPDRSAYDRTQTFARLPGMLCTPALAAWPLARALRERLRKPVPVTQVPDPILHWFRSEPDVRDFLSAKISAVSLVQLDSDQLLQLASEDWIPEQFFHRLVTSAITAQESLDLARARWRQAGGT